jgi:hypothetical protein
MPVDKVQKAAEAAKSKLIAVNDVLFGQKSYQFLF